MDKITLQLLNEYIKKYFYYVEYPDGLDKYFWKDANGKKQLMLVMHKEEITSCINRIKADLNRFYGCKLTETQKIALDAIFPLAQRVQNELEEQLEYHKQQEEEAKQKEQAEYLEFLNEGPRKKKPVHKRPKVNDITRVPIRVLLPLWMIKRLKAEGNIGPSLEKYLLKGGIKGNKGSLDLVISKIKADHPKNTNQFTDAWKKDIKNILNSSVNTILGFTQLALSPYKWPEETMNNYLNAIEKAAQRIKIQIDKL